MWTDTERRTSIDHLHLRAQVRKKGKTAIYAISENTEDCLINIRSLERSMFILGQTLNVRSCSFVRE